MSADAPVGPMRCQARTAAGEQCKRAALFSVNDCHSCAEPGHVEQAGTITAVHMSAAAEHLTDAMCHALWSMVPGKIRHLIEWAFIDIERAQGKL